MTRPFDWMPLAEADPLPGDPDAITVESARLARLGDDMRSQAARLRQIGVDTSLVGAYAEELRSASGDLAQDLDKVAGRYKRVACALKDWAPELAVAQAETLKARTKALEAEQLRSGHADTPSWGQEWQFLQLVPSANVPQLAEANQMFAEAQRMLRDTLEHAQARGGYYANLIDDANDIFKDGRWDNFKDWADRNAGWIENATKVMGWVATSAAIAAIFIPGANLLVLTAVGLTLASGIAHTMLAATGNGSWLDVGLDVFALLTFGIGLAAARGLQTAQVAGRTAAITAAGDDAAATVLRAPWNVRSAGLRAAAAARGQAGAEIARAPLAAASSWEAALVGGRPAAQQMNDLVTMAARFPDAPGMADAVQRGARFYAAAQASHLSGVGADAHGKAADIGTATRWLYGRARSAW